MTSSASPIILVPTQRYPETKRYSVGYDYVDSLVAAGANPFLSPVAIATRTEDLRRAYEMADGILLAGGPDCDPLLFGEVAHEKTEGIDPDRDSAELLLARWAAEDDKPLFGICRGVQMMNVAMGGTLIQDVPSQTIRPLRHAGDQTQRAQLLHTVCVEPDNRLSRIVGAGVVGVNSFHHQAVGRIATGYLVTARSDDGVIEGIENPELTFNLGVQWHPENLAAAGHVEMIALFREFVMAASAQA